MLVFLRVILVAAVCLGCLPAWAGGTAPTRPDGYEHRTFPAAVSVQAIGQTQAGFLWFAGTDGLRRFDGTEWQTIDQLPAGPARRLLVRGETVWVATGGGFIEASATRAGGYGFGFRTETGGVYRVTPDGVRAFDVRSLPSPWVWAMVLAPNGQDMWLGTENGLVRLRLGARDDTVDAALPQVDRPVPTDWLPAPQVGALHFDHDGGLWVGTSAGVVQLWPYEAARATDHVRLSEDAVFSLAHDEGGVAASTAKGVVRFANGGAKEVVRLGHPALASWGAPDVGLLVGATDRVFNARPPTQAEAALSSAPVSEAQAIFRDREGSYWFGSRSGPVVQSLRPYVRNFGAAEGLGGNTAFAILKTAEGSLWLSTTKTLSRWMNGSFEVWRYGEDLPVWATRDLVQTKDGRVIARADGDLLVYQDGRFRVHSPAKEQVPGGVASLARDVRGDLWLAAGDGGLLRLPGADLQSPAAESLSVEAGLCAGPQTFAGEAPAGTLWWSSEAGLSRIDGRGIRCFTTASGLPLHAVNAVIQSPSGSIWVGLMGQRALARLEGDTFVPLPARCAVAAGGFFALVGTGESLWATSNRGVFYTTWADVEECAQKDTTIDWFRFDEEAGMRSPICIASFFPSAAVDEHGDLWVPTTRGVSVLRDPRRQVMPAPMPTILGFVVDGTKLAVPKDGSERLSLGPGHHSLHVQWSAPTFVLPQAVRFAYALEGFDARWSDLSPQRSAHYAGLRPGNYRLTVRAGFAGIPLKGAPHLSHVNFHVAPSLSQRAWFRALLVAAGLALLLLLHWLRVRHVAAKYQAVHGERVRLAREIHDGIGQAFLGIRYHLDALSHLLRQRPHGEDATRLVDDGKAILTRAETDMRQAVWDLRSTQLHREGLRAALKATCGRLSRELRCKVDLDWVGQPDTPTGLLENELPRIVEEAAANAVKHGAAKSVEVRVLWQPPHLRVTITDDGSGLTKSPGARQGFGVVGMQERAARLGGVLTLAEGAGRGCVVTLELEHGII